MTQRNLRGAYVCFEHDRQADWDWLAKWQPNVIRYMAPGKPEDPNSVDVGRIKRIHDTCPDATILMRVWEIDDRNFAAHDEMVKDPVAEAERQVDWWAKVFDRAASIGVPREQLMAGLNNETGPEKDAALFDYTEAALKFGIQKHVRLGVFVFSVGRPSLAGESQYDMPYFAKLEPLILQAKSAVIVHEYMQPEGMYAVWTDDEGKERKDYTYLIGRHTRWPFSPAVSVIIGEWGIDGILYNRHPDPTYGNSGWCNFKKDWPPSRYADEYVECIRQASPNVIAICPYIEDWNDHKWQSFDVIGAYGELIARKDLCVKQIPDAPTSPNTIHLPEIKVPAPAPEQSSQPAPAPLAPIEPRVAQAILAIESAGQSFGPDGRPLIRLEAHIFKSQLHNDALWSQHFQVDANTPWTNQMWRGDPNSAWQPLHTNQASEYAAFDLARSLNPDAAYNAISVGSAQIVGFNHARIGYRTAEAMYNAFADGNMQVIGFINYLLSDPDLAAAMRNKDWRTIAAKYNGTGAIESYSKKLQQAYESLGGAV